MTSLVLTSDIGTSGCRAALFNNSGEIISFSEHHYQYEISSEGFAEQDPELVFRAFVDVVQRTARGYEEAISHIILDSVLHSLVLVDEIGNPLTSLSIWADTRAVRACADIRDYFNIMQWHIKTGCPLSPSYPFSRLLWYKNHLPQVYDSFAKALSIKSYIISRLFGVYYEDVTLASATGLFNPCNCAWDEEVLQFLALNVNRLPIPVPINHVIEQEDMLQSIGLSSHTKWVIGGGDGPMAHLGTAGDAPDVLSVSIGTSSAVRTLTQDYNAEVCNDIWTYLIDSKRYISGIASNNGGNVLDFYMRNLLSYGGKWEGLDAQLESCRHSKELLFFPYVFHERVVGEQRYPSGFLGIQPDHAVLDLIRVILEGIVFHVKHMIDKFTSVAAYSSIAFSGSVARIPYAQKTLSALTNSQIFTASEQYAPQIGSFNYMFSDIKSCSNNFIISNNSDYLLDKYALWCKYMGSAMI